MGISTIKYTIHEYLQLSKKEKIKHIEEVMGKRIKDFILNSDNDIPILFHKQTKLEFVYVPGGKYEKGFTIENQQAAEKISKIVNANYNEMRPVSVEEISAFLVTRTPILYNHIDVNDLEKRGFPVYCGFKEAIKVAAQMKMRLPSENEWEYFVRAGTKTLFPFGDELLEEKKLEKWMTMDFEDLSKSEANALGLYGIFTGEWTTDYFKTDYSDNANILESRTIRGGGAFFWPWQDQEWVWCMSSMRMPSCDLIDDSCSFRVIYDI